MQYKPGTLNDYTDSMGEKIRLVFEKLWEDKYGKKLPSKSKEERRLLFIAIAQGVMQHLQTNAGDAFDIEVNVKQQTNTGPLIRSTGTYSSHPITVNQVNNSSNKIMSTGQGKENIKVNILATGVMT